MPDEIQCRAVPKVQRDYSTGFRSMVYAWDKLKCDVLDLLGFNTTENLDSMYHYWRDGSRHDGVNSSAWYDSRKRMRIGKKYVYLGHDFAREHQLMREIQERVNENGFKATCHISSSSIK